MVNRRTQKTETMAKREASEEEEEEGSGDSTEAPAAADYEQQRAQRIKSNQEKMKNLGILELSKTLVKKSSNTSSKAPKRRQPPPAPSSPPRRSSRVKSMAPISYKEERYKNENKPSKDVKIVIKQGSNPEVYTEEHEKVLGDSKTTWELCIDGYDEDGKRMYDGYSGKSCHQCRQKTLSQHTTCSKCTKVSGQFCGDCLYMRYGENVIEVKENPDWVCPVCRGICNCSRCRKMKGWEPTGSIYRKVRKLGFKSVAHYLILTRRETNSGEPVDENKLKQTLMSVSSDEDKVEVKNEGEESDVGYDADEGNEDEDEDEDEDDDEEED